MGSGVQFLRLGYHALAVYRFLARNTRPEVEAGVRGRRREGASCARDLHRYTHRGVPRKHAISGPSRQLSALCPVTEGKGKGIREPAVNRPVPASSDRTTHRLCDRLPSFRRPSSFQLTTERRALFASLDRSLKLPEKPKNSRRLAFFNAICNVRTAAHRYREAHLNSCSSTKTYKRIHFIFPIGIFNVDRFVT